MTTSPDAAVGSRASRRPRRSPARRLVGVVVALALLGGGVYGGLRYTGVLGDSASPVCPLDAMLVPECGVLMGVTSEKENAASLAAVEKAVGGRFDLVYRFHDLDPQVPTEEERQLVAEGRTLHLALNPRFYTDKADQLVPWTTITSGEYDDVLRSQARGVKSLGAKVFVTFEHEADAPAKDAQGTPAEFKAAWRHVHDLYAQEGVDNAVWVWVVTGLAEQLERAGSLYPGDDVVDWVSWDVYNASGCRIGRQELSRLVPFSQYVDDFTRWLDTEGKALGIGADKPLMLSEVGSVVYADQPGTTAAWYADIPPVLARNTRIKSVTFWDHQGNRDCDYRFNANPTVARAVGSVLTAPEVSRLR